MPILTNKWPTSSAKAIVRILVLSFQWDTCNLACFGISVFNLFKLDLKTRASTGINFNVIGEHNTETSRTTGSLEAKYVVPAYGLTFLEKWNTDNLLKFELTADDQLAQGFKVVFDATLVANTGYVCPRAFNS